MTILLIDFQNFLHRARCGVKIGPAPVVFNFFRSLRALVEQHSPNRIVLALEGHPRHRHSLFAEYKANRVIEPGTAKESEMKELFKQKDEIVALLSERFPVSLVRHPDFEADDTIYNVIKPASTYAKWTVVSNDSDFIQLLQEFDNVELYNPMMKEFVQKPENYDYIVWKSLRGDGSDNIPGVPGVGDKTAEKLATDSEELERFFRHPIDGLNRATIFNRNMALIKFHAWSDAEHMQMTSTSPSRDWNTVRSKFESWRFNSITNDKSWTKFVDTFDHLFV